MTRIGPNTLRQDCEAVLRAHRWLAGMEAPLREQLLAAARPVRVAPGEPVVMAGDADGGLLGFATGTVSSRQSAAVTEIPMTDLHMAPFWLISRTILPGEEWVTTLSAVTPVTLLQVSRPALAQLMAEQPALTLHLLRNISAVFARMTVALSDALIRRADHRCIAVLLRISDRRFEGDTPVEVPIGQAELAGMANLSRQKTGDVLRGLEEAGLVELGYRRILVRAPAHLRALVEE